MREFNVSTGGATVANGSSTIVFLHATAGVNPNIECLRWWVGQAANATSAQQRIQIMSEATGFPTLVAATPQLLKRQDPNVSVLVGSTNGFTGTAGVTASSEGTGAVLSLWEDAFNVLNGWLSVPTPAETFINPNASLSGMGLRFPTTPGSLTVWSYGVIFREV